MCSYAERPRNFLGLSLSAQNEVGDEVNNIDHEVPKSLVAEAWCETAPEAKLVAWPWALVEYIIALSFML